MGTHKEKLQSFEKALRDAQIEKYNLVRVSSIFPPNCKVLTRAKGNSLLRPGAHIPAHNGLINTRLICHLPVIVPPGCRFRVGNDEREWVTGKAWAFDDTIEHEAWNGSQETRVILLFDVWRPELTERERAAVIALFETIDAHSGRKPEWEI